MSHCQDNNIEDLLRLLLRSDGRKFEEDIIKNWYRARKFVLGTLVANDIFDNIIRQQQKIHVVLEGTSELMMSVARQIAFVAHYPTFNDATGNNRTIITILFDKTKVSPSSILDFVSKEEYLYNLSRYCKCTIKNWEDQEVKLVYNENSFLDIELEYYMVLGGVAFYWSVLDKGKSVAQNIDSLLFSRTGQLHNEFNELYDSLFNNPEPYLRVIDTLGIIKVGLPRTKLLEKISMPSGAYATRILDDLEECGFIRKYNAFGKKRNDAIYQLIDNFTLFYFKFMKDNKGDDEHFWSHSYLSPVRYSWVGLAFERVCMQHVSQIKHKLGISGVLTSVSSWSAKSDPVYGQGAQIDMLIERADNVVNICEIKFSQDQYAISQEYSQSLAHKVERFLQTTKTKKTLHLTMITANGLAHNEYWGMVQSEVVADDLFHE